MGKPTKADLATRVAELEAENLLLKARVAAAESNALPCPGPHYPWPQYPQYPTYPTWPTPGIIWCGDMPGMTANGGHA